METPNVLQVDGMGKVNPNSILQSTLHKMAASWTFLLSKLATANAKLSAGCNEQAQQIIDDQNSEYQKTVGAKTNPAKGSMNWYLNKLKADTTPAERAVDQQHLMELQTNVTETQQVDSASQGVLTDLSDDAMTKEKQDVSSAASLVGQTAVQIVNTVYGTAQQLAEQISA